MDTTTLLIILVYLIGAGKAFQTFHEDMKEQWNWTYIVVGLMFASGSWISAGLTWDRNFD
jgi:hypothetical protein